MSSSTEVPMASSSSSSSSGGSNTAAPDGVSSTLAALAEGVKSFIGSTSAVPSSSASASTAAPTTVAAHAERANVADISSSLQHFGIVDYMVFVVMLIICAVIGFYFGFIEKKKKKRNIVERRGSEALDYLVGGRKMKVFPVSLSLVASFVSGISLLGTSTEIYVYGTQYAFILITLAISGVISWYVFLPVFCNLQLTSTYEYLERRFDYRVRLFGSTLFLILSVLWMPISIYVPALTFNQVTGINLHIITPIVCVVCTIYTSIGGIKGVVWTDVLQSVIMISAMLVVIIRGTITVGGLGVVYERNLASGRLESPEWTFDPTVRMGFFAVFVGGALFKLQNTCINQPTVQRFLSLPNLQAVKKCLIYSMFGLIFLLGLCIYLGLLAYAAYHDCDPLTTQMARAKDQVVPLYVMEIAGMYPGVTGLFVSGVFSAALSSLSTMLNSLSAVVLKDFIEPCRKTPLSERQTAIILRVVVVAFGLTSMAMVHIVEKLGLVMQLSATVGSMVAGPLLGLFTLGMLMPFVNTKSALAGCYSAAVVMGYVAIRAQIAIALGELHFPTKPVSVEGCYYDFLPQLLQNSTIADAPEISMEPGLHHISFLWYTGLGAMVTIVVALLATLYFGRQNIHDVDPNLVVPFLRHYIKPEKYMIVSNRNEEKTLNLDDLVFIEDCNKCEKS